MLALGSPAELLARYEASSLEEAFLTATGLELSEDPEDSEEVLA